MAWTIAEPAHSELLIRKSRFIGCVQPVTDREAAQAAVAGLRAAHPGAAHVCWALLAGGHSAAVDDGEPGGTAGRPMLEVLRRQALDGVLATVVRYYGGIKLGAGGLVRAYTDSIAQALMQAHRVPIRRMAHRVCRVPYALEGICRREISDAGASLTKVTHDTRVSIEFVAPVDILEALRRRLNDASGGRAEWADVPMA